jgi:MOSC domain-containing protein YiiM
MVSQVIESGRAGLYLRVIREGEAEAGMAMTLVDRPLPHWSMDRVFALLIAGGHRRQPEAVRALASEKLLAEAWRSRAERLVR